MASGGRGKRVQLSLTLNDLWAVLGLGLGSRVEQSWSRPLGQSACFRVEYAVLDVRKVWSYSSFGSSLLIAALEVVSVAST